MSENTLAKLVQDKEKNHWSLLFYVDTSKQAGLGHLIRTITLAKKFKKIKYKSIVASDNINGNIELPENLTCYKDIDEFINTHTASPLTIVLDTYNVKMGSDILNAIKNRAKKIEIIDVIYLCDTKMQAIKVLDKFSSVNILFPNILDEKNSRELEMLSMQYDKKLLHGIDCLLLDKEVIDCRPFREPIDSYKLEKCKIRCIMMFGYSSTNLVDSSKLRISNSMKTIRRIIPNIQFTLIGTNALHLYSEMSSSEGKYEYHEFCKKNHLIDLYDNSDFHIGALGYSMWERAARSLPSYVIPISDNQKPYVQIGEELGLLTEIDKLQDHDFQMCESLNKMIKAGNSFYAKLNKSIA